MKGPSPHRAIPALMLREMATVYGRSPGGYLWAVLEPVAAVTLLAVLFALAFQAPPVGQDFALFYASGYLPYMAFAEVSQKMGQSIRFSHPLLTYPAVTSLDAVLARFLLNGLTHLVIVAVVLTALILWSGEPVLLDPMGVMRALAMALGLAAGVGVLNAVLIARYGLWDRLWAIANRPLFILSGILFTFGSVPQPWRDFLWWNPLMHVTGAMRVSLYPGYDGAYVSAVYPMGLALVLGVLGLILLGRWHRDILADL